MKQFEVRSQEVQELLGNVPRWIIRWGTFLVLLTLIILFILSKALRYPDVIVSKVQLTANIPPVELKANRSGQVVEVFVSDMQRVERGEVLAVIQSAADYMDVLWLDKVLSDSFLIEKFAQTDLFDKNLNLGEIQKDFAGFLHTLEEYKSFVDIDYYVRKVNSLHTELDKYRKYMGDLVDQQKILSDEYKIVESQYNRDSLLMISGVISKGDLETNKQKKLAKLLELKQSNTRLSQANIEISELQHQVLDLELQLEQQNKRLYNDLKNKWNELRGSIAEWKKEYLIVSTIDGEVTLTRIWSENQYISEGEVVMIVLPLNYEKILGHLYIKPAGTGKVQKGDKVIIRFDNYPYLEYGVVTGRVESMSQASENDLYYARVSIDSNRLITNYNNELTFSQNMQGSAEIITESRSLFDRIFAPFKSALNIQKMYNED